MALLLLADIETTGDWQASLGPRVTSLVDTVNSLIPSSLVPPGLRAPARPDAAAPATAAAAPPSPAAAGAAASPGAFGPSPIWFDTAAPAPAPDAADADWAAPEAPDDEEAEAEEAPPSPGAPGAAPGQALLNGLRSADLTLQHLSAALLCAMLANRALAQDILEELDIVPQRIQRCRKYLTELTAPVRARHRPRSFPLPILSTLHPNIILEPNLDSNAHPNPQPTPNPTPKPFP